jgi:molecular chaperone DnaK|tara:strand:+ start:872 stop:2767 length:1896 start_codon:yes stop_codon:yes gene_type:complete
MGKIIGIDLGTTNSCVAIMEGGEPTIIVNKEGNRTTPSVVAFTDKERLVGTSAKRQNVTNPLNTISSVKRFIGSKYDEVKQDTKKVPYKINRSSKGGIQIETKRENYSAEQISAMVLEQLKIVATEHQGTNITEAVITVPAYFNDSQRQATKDAGKIAGLDVKRIINEPTAAALAYGLEDKKDQKIVVYDLGGGTFDVSVLELGDGIFEVKSTNGDTHLGGDNFDEALLDWLVSEYKNTSAIDLSNDPSALQRLRDAAELAKKELSSSSQTNINLPFITANESGPQHLDITLTRAKFDNLTEELVNRTKEPCINALKDAGMTTEDIDEVILVGGSTRIPLVRKVVEELFNKQPNHSVNPDEVVALGAAVQGGVLSGDVTDVLLLDVTPLSLGIETLGGVVTQVIERNTTIPTNKKQTFTTAAENQSSVEVHVLQGERKFATDNKSIGRFHLEGIIPAPKGTPQIEVTFDIDANGILSVSAKDLGTGKEQSIRITSSTGLSDSEVEQMISDAKKHKQADTKKAELVELKNKSSYLITQCKKTVEENKEVLSKDQIKDINSKVETLEKQVGTDDAEGINKRYEELNTLLGEISNSMHSQQTSDVQEEPSNDENSVDAEYEVVDDKSTENVDDK